MRLVLLCVLALSVIPSAHAYTGPGLGLGIIGTVLGVAFSLLLAILAIFWYPLKRALKIGKKKADDDTSEEEEEPQPTAEDTSDPR